MIFTVKPPKKTDELDKLHIAMKEELTLCSYPQKIQLLTLVPDSWSRGYRSKYYDVSEYLIRSPRDLKRKSQQLPTKQHQ